MDRLMNSRITQLEDELLDARRTISRLERRDTYLQDEAKQQAATLAENLATSRRDRDELRAAVQERDARLIVLGKAGEEQRQATDKTRDELRSKITALQVDGRMGWKVANERMDVIRAFKLREAAEGADEKVAASAQLLEEAKQRQRKADETITALRADLDAALAERDAHIQAMLKTRQDDHKASLAAKQRQIDDLLIQLSRRKGGSDKPFSDSSVEVIEISDDETPTANDSDKQIKGKPVLKHHLKANRKVGLIIPDFTRSKAGCDDQAAPSPLPSLLMLKRHSSAASSSSRDLDVDLQLLAKRRKLHELVASHCPSLSAPATSPAALPGTETSFTCPRPSSLTSLPPSLNARVSSYASVCVPRSFPTLSAMSKYYGFVRRDFLLEQYGCSDRQFLSKISVKRNIPLTANRDRYVLFPMWANKPSLPTVPGQPGTLTTGRCDMLMYSPLSIFVRAPDKPLWIYLGNYELRKSKKPLSAHEFKALPYECRMKWAKDILTPQRSQCYTTMRARVWLRKQGRQVTADALEEAMEDLKKTADKIGLVEADVLNALDAGEEELNVHLCIPVSYNADFSQDMSKHFAIKQMAALSLKKATPISGEATGSSTIPVRRSMRTRRHGPPFKTDPTAADVDAGEGEQDDANDSESS